MRASSTHDPYRPSDPLIVPQLGDAEPVDGKVRILAVVDRYPPWVNAGAEWMLHSILRRMLEQGHECRVVTALPEKDPATGRRLTVPQIVDGVHVYPYDLLDDMAEWADVLVGHLLWTRDVVQVAADHRLPLMYLMHNDQQIAHWNLHASNVTVMVWNSEWVRDKCEPRWGGPSFVCRPPVFCDDYAVDGFVDDAGAMRQFVTLVNPIPEKGVGVFYDLARRRHRDRFLAVEGAYGHQHRPPYFIQNVEMIRPTANMAEDVYARTRVLLMPSSYESWGRVAVEAMAAGCPVIAHPTAGLREACGDAALFADREDVDAWVAALATLDDVGTWIQWSERGKARAAELERVTDADLVTFDQWVRRCAAARIPVVSG